MIKILRSDAITCAYVHDMAHSLKQHFRIITASLLQSVSYVIAEYADMRVQRIPCFNTHYATMRDLRNFQRKEKTINQPWLWPHLTFD